jgi:hypothetical protein
LFKILFTYLALKKTKKVIKNKNITCPAKTKNKLGLLCQAQFKLALTKSALSEVDFVFHVLKVIFQ